MLTSVELNALAKQTANLVREATAPLVQRIAQLEARQPERGEKGKDGQDGRDAEVNFDDIVKAVEKVHDRLIAKYMLDFERRAADTIQKAIDKIPAPKDGRDGKDGRDAEIDYDQVVKTLEEIHERFAAKFMLEFERRGLDTIQRTIDKLPVPKDGVDGKDGRDGVGFDDVEFEFDGERTVTAKFVRGGSVLKSVPWKFPVIIDKGYWKEGVKAEKGDAMTEAGTLYIALRDTAEKPSTGAKDWRIGARKGRDAATPPVKINAP